VGYFKTLSVTNYIVSNVKLFTNHEFEVVVCQSRDDSSILEGLRKPTSILVRIAGVTAEIQTEHLPNANLQRWR
jgi:hypothetical protein